MHGCKCPIQDGDVAFYIQFSTIVIFSKMNHHFCACRALLERDVQTFGRQELDANVLKYALLDGYKMHNSKLVLTRR